MSEQKHRIRQLEAERDAAEKRGMERAASSCDSFEGGRMLEGSEYAAAIRAEAAKLSA